MGYHWNWKILFAPEPGGSGTFLHYLVVGLGWSLATALTAWVMALAIGSIVGTLRTTPHPWVVRLGNAYVEIFRNIPLLVQMFLWFFVVPELLPTHLGARHTQDSPSGRSPGERTVPAGGSVVTGRAYDHSGRLDGRLPSRVGLHRPG